MSDDKTPSNTPPNNPPRAADGRPLPTAFTLGQFLQLLEDGEFHAEVSDALQEINAALTQYVLDYGGKPKGKLTIAVDFTLDKGVFEITGDYTVKLPKAPRGKTVAWSTPENRFTPQNPRQMQMFGVRDVTPASESGAVRNV